MLKLFRLVVITSEIQGVDGERIERQLPGAGETRFRIS